MTTTTLPLTGKDGFLADHLKLLQRPLGPDAAWVDRLRKHGLDRFVALGFPTTRDEAWRQTSLNPLLQTSFQSPDSQPAPDSIDVAVYRDPAQTGAEVVFIDGRVARITGQNELPRGVQILNFASALQTEQARLEPHLARYANLEQNAFIALNTAFLEEGVAILIPRGVVVEQPIHLLFISGTSAHATHAHPRVLVIAEANSQVTIVETWASAAPEAVYFNNPVTEVAAGENAVVRHIKVQRESLSAFHVANTQYHLARAAQVHAHGITLGGALVRNEIGATLDGEGAHCGLHGLYLTAGTQHVDNHTHLDHAQPHCTSEQIYKGILDHHSTGVFTGKILVRPDAQKTDAIQRNRALLLDPAATIHSQPQLEIFADDVRCTHGATVGQLNEDALFYLRARGIGRDAAEGLLTYAFANEIIEQLPAGAVRTQLEHHLATRFKIIGNEPS